MDDETQEYVSRARNSTLLVSVNVIGWSIYQFGWQAGALVLLSFLLGWLNRHVVILFRIKGMTKQHPLRSMQRVDWNKEIFRP